ncbi:MAG: TM0106 family RecB-like putative nuclease [Patescibacteria group bacterium]|nr:TM0106 family RecB-like putative nuclease [Patescibacteria group bacterium]
MPRLSASQLYNFSQCPYRVHLDIFGDEKEKSPESDFLAMLIEEGVRHEKDAIAEMPFLEVEARGTLTARAEVTRDLMKKKTPWIYQGVLLTRTMVGIPDILEYTGGRYIPVEIKSGAGLKEAYIQQICFYDELLGELFGRRSGRGKIINIKKEILEVDCNASRRAFLDNLAALKKIASGEEESELAIGSDCNNCHWRKFCEEKARAEDDLTLIHGLGRAFKEGLRQAGIKTQGQAAKVDPSLAREIRRLGPAKLEKFREQAKVNIAGKMMVFARPTMRCAPLEIFIDLEGDPMLGIDYLIGMIVRKKGKEQYVSFVARRPEDEAAMWEEFLNFMAGISEDYILYHYHNYEKVHFKMLFEKYGGDGELYHEIDYALEDLKRTIDKSMYLPLTRYSLKCVARHLGFEWRAGEEAGGANSIIWYEKYLGDTEKNADLMQKIIDYNADDCRATRVVKDWLEKI